MNRSALFLVVISFISVHGFAMELQGEIDEITVMMIHCDTIVCCRGR